MNKNPFNAVIATAIMRRLNIPHIPYELLLEKTLEGDNESEKAYSICKNFVTTQTELVPAWRVVQTRKRINSNSELAHLLRCCEGLGMDVSDISLAIDKMLTPDYIIANEDRHYNSFGFLRNADTLEWPGFAPILDSGTSLWYNTQIVGSKRESKPFKKSHDEQLKLVKNLSWFDYDLLKGIENLRSISCLTPLGLLFAIAPALSLCESGALRQFAKGKPLGQVNSCVSLGFGQWVFAQNL